jgi:hypothetical protein
VSTNTGGGAIYLTNTAVVFYLFMYLFFFFFCYCVCVIWRISFCVAFMCVCAFKQNITQCKFGGNSAAAGNDIYFGGSDYPAEKVIDSCSTSSRVKFYSPSGDFSSYLPQCFLYPKAYVAASGLPCVSMYMMSE